MRGRPLKFDKNQALKSAMMLFWRNGYEGTSLSELTAAMNINRPSLYGTFGDKEKLFFQVLNLYLADYGTRGVRELSKHSSIYEGIEGFLNCAVEQLTDSQLPPGCLIANSTLECGGNRFDAIGRRLSQCHAETEAALYNFLRLAKTQGQISETEDLQALAQFFTTTMLGMGVIARTNPNPVMIRQVAKTALRVLPSTLQLSKS
jgi:TetR/AcrR family transcriptional regulator, copper-responsive repressor